MSVSRIHRSAVTQDVVATGPAELAGTWEFDPAHTRLGFLAPQMMVTTIRGTFGEVVGGATLDPANPQNCGVSVTIQANSINTGSPRRDAHLRSAAYFEVEKYPTIEFRSSELRPTKAPEVWTVAGDLTIRGVTRPVELTMTYLGVSGDPSGGTRAGFEGTAKVNRKDWGVSWSRALEGGGVVVGDHIKLELKVQAIKRS
jgi:polyisoprenoid-binding protein YceI